MRKSPEKAIERMCMATYKTFGCRVIHFSQPRRTMQTRGIPDLLLLHAKSGTWWWHEVKAPKGRQSECQVAFQRDVEACGHHYFLGGMEAALEALRTVAGVKIQT